MYPFKMLTAVRPSTYVNGMHNVQWLKIYLKPGLKSFCCKMWIQNTCNSEEKVKKSNRRLTSDNIFVS